MSGPDALVRVAEALAWPIGISLVPVVGLVVFRKQLRRLLGGRKLTRSKAGPFEAEWTESVVKVEAATVKAIFYSAAASRPTDGAAEPRLAHWTETRILAIIVNRSGRR